jgi:hypothetical protein
MGDNLGMDKKKHIRANERRDTVLRKIQERKERIKQKELEKKEEEKAIKNNTVFTPDSPIKNKMGVLLDTTLLFTTPEEVDKVRGFAKQVLITARYKEDVDAKIAEIFEKALIGWNRCPKTFYERVVKLLGTRSVNKWYQVQDKKRQEEEKAALLEAALAKCEAAGVEIDMTVIKDKSVEDAKEYVDYYTKVFEPELYEKEREALGLEKTLEQQIETIYNDSLFNYLNLDEKNYWKVRDYEYRKEFDFNDSSDRILLEQLIYLEIMLRRIRLFRLTGKYNESIKGLDESKVIDDHRKAMEKLGILRIQRIQSDSNVEGNVGEISMSLDVKLEEIKAIKDNLLYTKTMDRIAKKYKEITIKEIEQLVEEHILLKQIEREPALNPIPQAVYQSVITKIDGNKANMQNMEDKLKNYADEIFVDEDAEREKQLLEDLSNTTGDING